MVVRACRYMACYIFNPPVYPKVAVYRRPNLYSLIRDDNVSHRTVAECEKMKGGQCDRHRRALGGLP